MGALLSYALFNADPTKQPPFNIDLAFGDKSQITLGNCASIPDGVKDIENFCKDQGIQKSPTFKLIYPIYMNAMGTDDEDTMHQVAWLIKDEADKMKWGFERVGGYTGVLLADFI